MKPSSPQPANATPTDNPAQPGGAQVIALRPPGRWHDPLRLIQNAEPGGGGRAVLWTVCVLVLALVAWAACGQLDIIAGAEGRLVPQTLVKIVQPAESGVVTQLLVNEGDSVKAGQVLARLDTTLAKADTSGVASDLATQTMQLRRIEAQLANRTLQRLPGDDALLFAQVLSQTIAHRQSLDDGLAQEKSLLVKAEHERRSAEQVLAKLEQTLPTYRQSAAAYARLEKEGYVGGLAAAEKQREAIEKAGDLDAQKSMVAALNATIAAQTKKISQLESAYRSDLEKELAEIRAKIAQLRPQLDKTRYKEALMELRAPQDGTIKDLATTTVGAVVQPGTVVLTLVPKDEQLYADVNISNEDVGFVRSGQSVQIKLAAYPFQKYGMLAGKVIHVSADASESANTAAPSSPMGGPGNQGGSAGQGRATYKARIQLGAQGLTDPQGHPLRLAPGMLVMAEINQGKRTVLEYLLSPVQKAATEAARER